MLALCCAVWLALVQVKKVTHKLPEKNFAYGINKPRQAEGAREVSMMWVAHKGNPDAKPGPDFMAMNKLAAQAVERWPPDWPPNGEGG